MSEIPARADATTWLVGILRHALSADPEIHIGIGDGIAPPDYGWSKGQPGVGSFTPYAVVKEMSATQQRGPQPLGTAQTDAWLFPYTITGWGEVREQAGWVCDQVNATLAGVDPRGLSGDNAIVAGFTVQQLVVGPLGPTQRDDKTAPPTWSRNDVCTLWLARAQPRRRG